MSVFKTKTPCVVRPAGESDEEGSSEDDIYDMPGFSRLKRKQNTYTPYVNGNNDAGNETYIADDDWSIEHTENASNRGPPVENWGRTPAEEIKLFCVRGNLEKLKRSLENGTLEVVDAFFSDEFNPLMTAAARGHSHILEFLISKNANVNLYHHNSKITALMAAVSCSVRREEEDVLHCVKLLVDAKADVNFQDMHGISALGMAVKRRRITIIQYLLNYCNADANLIDSIGRTCLFYSAEIGEGKICRILLEKGADVNIVDDNGWTAAESANDKGCYKLAELLHIVRDTKWKPGLNPSLMQEMDENAAMRRLQTPVADGVTVREDSQLEILLGSFNAQKYIENFRKHRITFLQFLELDEEQLKEIGIAELGVRKKLVDSIREIHNQEWQASSIKAVAVNKKITAAEAVCMVNNLKMHLQYMSKTLLSMRNRIQKDPQCLQLGKERSKMQDLISLCKEMDKGNEGLKKEVVELIQYLQTIEGNAEFKLGDEVKILSINKVKSKWDNANSTSSYKWILGLGVGLVVLFASSNRISCMFNSIRLNNK